MKLKNYWKRFWTLDRHHAAGFTLVELIVVIAILAILAGVGIPVYSGYITKANKQADMTLISEIENALTLAGYNGTFADGASGYITLSTDTPFTSTQAVAGSDLDNALKAAFGDNYSLELSYDGWDTEASMLSWLVGYHKDENGAQAANNSLGEIQNVAGSSFLIGNTTDELLTNVENLTTKLAGIVEVMDEAGKQAVYNMFICDDGNGNQTNAFQTVMDKHGYTSVEDIDSTTLSNLVVLASAEEMKNMDSTAIMNGKNQSPMSAFVTYYSLYTAYAANENSSQAYKDKYAQLQKDIQNESNPANIMFMLENFAVNITGDGNSIPADSGWAAYSGGDNPAGSVYFKDIDAFASIMDAVDNAEVSNKDLNDATLFTQGTANTLFGSYVSSVNMINNMSQAEFDALVVASQNGGVSVLYSYADNEILVTSSLPELG